MQENLSRKQPRDNCHTLQTSQPMTTSDSTRENYTWQLKTESKNHHMKGRPTCQSGGPPGPVGRPPGPLRSPFTLHRLVCVFKIYTVNFKMVLSQFIQWWSRELTRINDVSMPCPLLHLPYIRRPYSLEEAIPHSDQDTPQERNSHKALKM